MSRSVAWRRTLSDGLSWTQDQSLNATIYIVREVGPTGFLLKEEGVSKPFKALLGDPHSCTCPQFRKDRDLCKHICWLLLKRFRIPREDPLSWQLGLVEREIVSILREDENRVSIRNRPETARPAPNSTPKHEGRSALEQREIEEGDTCPICMEELLAKREPVTYCRYSCANSIHIKCMKMWAEHQVTQDDKTIKCPYCREDFGPHEYLREEYRNTVTASRPAGRVVSEHRGTLCRLCNQSPITGKCYRCNVCTEYHLCQKCFNTPTHQHHSFDYRSSTTKRWRPAQRIATNGLTIPSAVADSLMAREISEQDYDTLLQLDNPAGAALSQIPESAVQKFALVRVRVGSRYLAPGEQCCVCLRSYQPGDFLRRLPCRHKFHRDCIDNWLLHQHPTCPVDGQVVWSEDTDTQQADRQRGRAARGGHRSTGSASRVEASSQEPALEIPGIGIGRWSSHSAPALVRGANQAEPAPGQLTGLSVGRLYSGLDAHVRARSTPDSPASANASSGRTPLHRDPVAVAAAAAVAENPYILFDTGDVSSTAERAAVARQRVGVAAARTGTQSDTEAENHRRRTRNMRLAANFKQSGGGVGEPNHREQQPPSISTQQPADASLLYLGNVSASSPTDDRLHASRRVAKGLDKPRLPPTQPKMDDQRFTSIALSIGDGPATAQTGNAPTRRLTGKPAPRKTVHHSPNLNLLELTGTKW